jgi:hypothetical protein
MRDSSVPPATCRDLMPAAPTQLRAQTFRVFVYATSAPLISFGFSMVVESRAVLSS